MREVYAQVLITCTTINVFILILNLLSWVEFKISDHRKKKKENNKQ